MTLAVWGVVCYGNSQLQKVGNPPLALFPHSTGSLSIQVKPARDVLISPQALISPQVVPVTPVNDTTEITDKTAMGITTTKPLCA